MKFKIHKRRTGDPQQRYWFTVVAPNGEITATSEMYASKQGARIGIESICRGCWSLLTSSELGADGVRDMVNSAIVDETGE